MPDRGSGPANRLGIVQPQGFPSLPDGWLCDWEAFPARNPKPKLFGVHFRPDDAAFAADPARHRALFLVHGLGEHGGRYLHIPAYLKETVGSVYCIDLRGHGRSEGLRGHVERFDEYTEDIAFALSRLDERLKGRFGRSEIHLLGHSMGGLVVLRTALGYAGAIPVRSVTVSAPLLGIRVELPAVKRGAARLLSKVWPSLHMDNEINPADFSHDPAVIEAFKKDRLVHHKGTPRLYTEMLAAIADTNLRDSGISQPIQFLIPDQDRIVDAPSAIRFFERLKHRDKELKVYPGFFHESFNETGKEKVFEDLNRWIRQHSETN